MSQDSRPLYRRVDHAVRWDKSIHIQAPPETVYAWLSPERAAAWNPRIVRAETTTPASVHRTERLRGHRFEATYALTAQEPGHHLAWRQDRGDYARAEEDFTLTVTPDGATTLRWRITHDYAHVLPFFATDDELRREESRAADDALYNLKSLAERTARAARSQGGQRE